MPSILSPRPLAAVSLLCALVFTTNGFAQATAQALDPTVQKQADGLRAKITAKTYQTSIKDVLFADLATGTDPKLSANSQFRALDALDGLINNTQLAFDSYDAYIKYISTNAAGNMTLLKRYSGLANDNFKWLPRNYNGFMSTMSRLQGEFENFLPVIARLKKFATDVRASSKATQALKDTTARFINDTFGEIVTGTATSMTTQIDNIQDIFNNSLFIIESINAFEAKVRTQVPANFPRFRDNTIAEAEHIRAGVASGLSLRHLDDLGNEYRRRLALVNNAVEILRWIKEKPQGAFVDPPIISRLDKLMTAIENYRSDDMNSAAVEEILIQVRYRG